MDAMFRRLGMPDPFRMAELVSKWDDLAGDPWKGRSRPVGVENGVLSVEANTPSLVALLRYGEAELLTVLTERFGRGFVERVVVIPPGRG